MHVPTHKKNMICLASPFPFPFDSSLGQLLSLDSLENSLGVYKTDLAEECYRGQNFKQALGSLLILLFFIFITATLWWSTRLCKRASSRSSRPHIYFYSPLTSSQILATALTKSYCSINFLNNFVLEVKQQACSLSKSQCLPNSSHHYIQDKLKPMNKDTDTYLVFLFCLLFIFKLKIKAFMESKTELKRKLLFLDKRKCNLAQGRMHRTVDI